MKSLFGLFHRPTLELHGQTYSRQNGAWVGSTTHLAASVAVSIELDRLAKRDSEFWDRCREQDHRDDPRRKGVRIRSIFKQPDTVELTPVPSSQTPKRRRQVTHHGLDYRFTYQRKLVLTCDIEAGWRETATGWRFAASNKVELPAGWVLHCSVTIAEDTYNWERRVTSDPDAVKAALITTDLVSPCPDFVKWEGADGVSTCCLDENECVFLVPLLDEDVDLNSELRWTRSGGVWAVCFADFVVYDRPRRVPDSGHCTSRPFRLKLDGTLHPPRPEAAKPTYVRDTPMPSAGLPSLGKRR